jgi:hypothetical protein
MPFDGFLNDDAIRAKAPSVFATQAADNVSAKYAYLPTYQAVRAMRVMGFEVAKVREGYKRSVEGRNYAIHELRMRKVGAEPHRELGDLVPEVLLRNSHDRTSGFSLSAGIFRLVCLNGMTVAESGFHVNLRHVGAHQLDRLHTGIAMIQSQLPKTLEIARDWSKIVLSLDQVSRFAQKALEIRGTSIDIQPAQVLRPRRYNDENASLWNVFNRVQENLTVGGMRGQGANGQRRAVSGIRTLAADVSFNTKLWAAASELAAEVKPVSVVSA